MQIRVAGWLINKRKMASTAGAPLPQIPIGTDPIDPVNQTATPNVQLVLARYQNQKHINMCGEACVTMLYEYHHDNAGVNMNVNPRGVLEGADAGDLRQRFPRLRSWTFRTPMTPRRLAYGLLTYGPLIASGDFARFMGKRWGHYILVTGVVGDTVLIADPWHGEDRRKSMEWFKDKLDTPMMYYE